ncbi:MAG TPA: hypothetical protein VI759_06385 [Dehalococcoidia bacterium]|nr:hypothetical protein [Dehalococcoidia bacterium]
MLHAIEQPVRLDGPMDDTIGRLRADMQIDLVPSVEKPGDLTEDEGLREDGKLTKEECDPQR